MLYLFLTLMLVLSIVLLSSALFTQHIRLTGKNLKARRRRNRLATPSSVETGDWGRVICLTRKSICGERLRATSKECQRVNPRSYV